MQDNALSVAQAIYELPVHRVTRARPILWVDDTDYLTDTTTEGIEDERWVEVLGRLARDHHFDFDENADIFSVADNRKEPPPIPKIFDYQAVVWSVRSNQRGQSALRTVAQFVDPLPSRHQNSAKSYNYLNVYLANGGTLWLNGFRAARQLWPTERLRGHEWDPVNVTNWDDPIEAHPQGIDSVGTTSLLYGMGIEMFDVGSATDSPRTGLGQFCRGLAPGDADAAAGAPSLALGPLWAQVAGTTARTNVEIYNMPGAMRTQKIPLVPLPGHLLHRVLLCERAAAERNDGVRLSGDRGSPARLRPGQGLARCGALHPGHVRFRDLRARPRIPRRPGGVRTAAPLRRRQGHSLRRWRRFVLGR